MILPEMKMNSGMDTVTILNRIRKVNPGRPVKLMEVCGTHTMAIAANGIRSLLPENIKLLSGPGCPVCVTPVSVIDRILELAMQPDIVIATYGDMVRVPGSTRGDSLARRRALGADVQVVYSPMDAVLLAEENPEKQVVFLGIGFETTAPGTAVAILSAAEKKLGNFSVYSILKTVEPALRKLIATDGFDVDGFLCPGHVATVIGSNGFRFLPEEYRIPAVVAGFEAEDILKAICSLLEQICDGQPKIENEYVRAVSSAGNSAARNAIKACFVPRTAEWRGLGEIRESGLAVSETFREFDAERKFRELFREQKKDLHKVENLFVSACRCGDIITGRAEPYACPLFGNCCTPEDPIGPCMVSGEGSCAAAYKFTGF